MLARLLTLLLCLGVAAGAAGAQDRATIDRVNAAVESWANGIGARETAHAVTYRGALVAREGEDRPVELASLSKMITAVCVAQAVTAGRLTYDDTLGELLAERVRFGDPRVAGVTVGQLITHSSGIWPDGTQTVMHEWVDDPEPRHWQVAEAALERGWQAGTLGAFRYNNENYAILGTVYDAVTGGQYAAECGAMSGATPSPRAGAYLAWGGWQMPIAEQALFWARWFGDGGEISEAPETYPHIVVEGGAGYGMGVFQRRTGEAWNFWHAGALCMPGRLNAGSWAVIWQGEWGVSVAVDTCPAWEDFGALDRALIAAVFR